MRALGIAVLTLLLATSAMAQDMSADEVDYKANFIIKLIQYVEWPAGEGTEYRIKVSETDGEPYDISKANFTVTDSSGVLQLSSSGYTAHENDGTVQVTVTRTGGSTGAVSVLLTARIRSVATTGVAVRAAHALLLIPVAAMAFLLFADKDVNPIVPTRSAVMTGVAARAAPVMPVPRAPRSRTSVWSTRGCATSGPTTQTTGATAAAG